MQEDQAFINDKYTQFFIIDALMKVGPDVFSRLLACWDKCSWSDCHLQFLSHLANRVVFLQLSLQGMLISFCLEAY